MYINGEWIQTDRVVDVTNPATGEIIDKVYAVEGRNKAGYQRPNKLLKNGRFNR